MRNCMWLTKKIKDFFLTENPVEAKMQSYLDFKDIPAALEKRREKQNALEEELRRKLTARIKSFEKDVSESLAALEMIDLSEKKEHEKIKIVVGENLRLYISYVQRFLEDARKLSFLDLEQDLNRIVLVLRDFESKSNISFQKATILIGEDLANVRKIIREFGLFFNGVSEECRNVLESARKVKKLSENLNALNDNMTYKRESEEKISSLEKDILKNLEEKEKLEKEIENISKSDRYSDDLRNKEERRENLKVIDREIESLKKKIDLKSLIKKVHGDSKKSKLVGDYTRDFKLALLNDNEFEIIFAFGEDKEKYFDLLKKLRSEIEELGKDFITKTDEELALLRGGLSEKELGKKSIEIAIESEKKRADKISAKTEKLISDIKDLAVDLFDLQIV